MYSCLSLIVTGDCNFDCSYCYQAKDGLFLDSREARKAIDFFFPRFDADCTIMFCGGEPLLAMDTIRAAVQTVRSKGRPPGRKVSYSISTNGSLLDQDALAFFDQNKFTVLLSFDGLAQDKGRKPGSYRRVSAALGELLERPGIELLTNSVFTPETVDDLSVSIRDVVERGSRNARITLANERPWGESAITRLEGQLSDLRLFLFDFARRTGRIPVSNFGRSDGAGIFGCLAGENRMALSPDGRLWGCHLFYDFHKKMNDPDSARFCFGTLDSFIAHHGRTAPRVLPRYAGLRMDRFHTPRELCGLCGHVHDCVVCPVDAAFSTGIVGRIGMADCRIRKVFREQKRRLWEDLDSHAGKPVAPRRRASRQRTAA